MPRVPRSLALALLAVLFAAGAARADAKDAGRAVLEDVSSRWTRWKDALARGDRTAAESAAREVRELLRDEGIGRLPPMAEAAVLEGRRALEVGRPPDAIAAFRLAQALDPRLPGAFWGEARARVVAGDDYGSAARLAWRAAMLRAGSFWPAYSDAVRLLAVLFFALLLAAAAGVVVVLALHGPTLAHEVEERLPTAWHPAWRRAVGWALVLSPAAVQWLGVFGLVPWAVALAPAATRAQRALIASFLVLLACAVPIGGALWVLAGVASSTTARVAVASAERTLEPELGVQLAALAEAQPREARWKLLEARLYGARQPDVALRLLRDAAEAAPNDPRVHVAIGNVFFRSGKKETAAVHYRDALRLAPDDVVALFNLQRVRTATFDTRGGENLLLRARTARPALFDEIARDTPPDDVADPRVPVREVARQVLAQEAVPGVRRALAPSNPVTLAAIAAAIGAVALSVRGARPSARRCVRCGRAYCARCAAEDRAPDTCSACHQLFSKKAGLAPAARQSQARRVDQRLTWLARGRFIAQLLWPGLGLIHEGRTGLGFLQATVWAFLLLGAAAPEAVLPASSVVPIVAPGLPSALCAVLFWILVQTPALRPSSSPRRAGA